MGQRHFTFLRLHVITWLVLAVALVVLMLAQVPRLKFLDAYRYGWPTSVVIKNYEKYASNSPSPPSPPSFHYDWYVANIAKNVAACGAMLLAAGWLTQRWASSPSRFNFTLTTMLRFTAALAMTLAFLGQRGDWIRIDMVSSVFDLDATRELSSHERLLRRHPSLHPYLQPAIALLIVTFFYFTMTAPFEIARRLVRGKPSSDDAP